MGKSLFFGGGGMEGFPGFDYLMAKSEYENSNIFALQGIIRAYIFWNYIYNSNDFNKFAEEIYKIYNDPTQNPKKKNSLIQIIYDKRPNKNIQLPDYIVINEQGKASSKLNVNDIYNKLYNDASDATKSIIENNNNPKQDQAVGQPLLSSTDKVTGTKRMVNNNKGTNSTSVPKVQKRRGQTQVKTEEVQIPKGKKRGRENTGVINTNVRKTQKKII